MALGLTGVLVVGLLWVVVVRLRRLRRWMALDPGELVVWLRRSGGDGSERLRDALASSAGDEEQPRGSYARLAAALTEADRMRRAAGCNEALLELEGGLGGGIDEGGGLLRLLVLGTLLALALGVLGGELSGGETVAVLGLAGGGALTLLTSSRESRALVVAWRRGVDGWVAAGLRRWGEEQGRKVDARRRSV